MKKVKFCKDCKWSRSDKRNYGLHCVHPLVVANYPWALSRSETPYETDEYNRGTDCHEERSKKWFCKCGLKGKLWEEVDKWPRCEGYKPTVSSNEPTPPGDE